MKAEEEKNMSNAEIMRRLNRMQSILNQKIPEERRQRRSKREKVALQMLLEKVAAEEKNKAKLLDQAHKVDLDKGFTRGDMFFFSSSYGWEGDEDEKQKYFADFHPSSPCDKLEGCSWDLDSNFFPQYDRYRPFTMLFIAYYEKLIYCVNKEPETIDFVISRNELTEKEIKQLKFIQQTLHITCNHYWLDIAEYDQELYKLFREANDYNLFLRQIRLENLDTHEIIGVFVRTETGSYHDEDRYFMTIYPYKVVNRQP